jgi:hypothetical protein
MTGRRQFVRSVIGAAAGASAVGGGTMCWGRNLQIMDQQGVDVQVLTDLSSQPAAETALMVPIV